MDSSGDIAPINVLFALQNNFDLVDMSGPLEVLHQALHDVNDESTKAFECTLAAAEPDVMSSQGVIVKSQISFKEAHENLTDYDVIVVVGGGVDAVLEANAEPLQLIKAYADLQTNDPSRERTLMSVCTGSMLLAKQGILLGLSATTHPYYIVPFMNLCKEAHKLEPDIEPTDVLEDTRYVVSNLRFEIGDRATNPHIHRKSDARPPKPRMGSVSFKESNTNESMIARRAALPMGGLRVITSGGVSAGVDAALYLVSILVSDLSAKLVEQTMQWTWTKGTVISGLDV